MSRINMINYYFNYYKDKDEKRRYEIDCCLRKLTENQSINLYVMVEDIDTPLPFSSDNTHIISLKRRPTFSDIILLIDKTSGHDDINIFSNSDCFIDDKSIPFLQRMSSDDAYCLSRVEIRKAYPLKIKRWKTYRTWKKHLDMQDCWCIKGKPRPNMKLDFYMGKPGCDNRLAYEFTKVGYTISNPRSKISVYHFHTTELRRYSEPERVPEPYAFPPAF